VRAVERPGEFGAARADEAGQAEDLPGTQVEGDVPDARRGQPADGQHDRGVRRGLVPGRERGADGPAEQRGKQRVLGLAGRRGGAHHAPVAQDGHLVGELEHLAEEVRDQHHGRAGTGQPADDLVQRGHVGPGQGRGRLVHHDQLGPAAQRAQDLHLLLVRRPQAAGVRLAGQLEACRAGQLGVAPGERARLQEACPARLGAEEDVLRDGQRGRDRQLLRDQHDAAGDRVPWRAEPDRLAAEQQLTAVRGEHARDDLPEGRLARAVLAHQRVDRAAGDQEVDSFQGARAAEGLRDVPQLSVRALGTRLVRCRHPATGR
jgi:hypothetical protein